MHRLNAILLSATAVGALALAAGPALADADVLAEITVTKTVDIFEDIDVVKDINFTITVDPAIEKAAESLAILNQLNTGNTACSNCAEKRDLFTDSGNFNSGVIVVNQAAGNMNNQGSAISAAVDAVVVPGPGEDGEVPPSDPLGFADAQASSDQQNLENMVDSINLAFREALIMDALNDNTGIIHVNQTPGNMNNQGNELSISVSFEAGVALAEADLGQVNTGNTVLESDQTFEEQTDEGTVVTPAGIGINKTATLSNAVNFNTGIIGVNQGAGNMANQANVVAIGAAVVGAPAPAPVPGV